jgi:hypothetical protein
MLRTQVGAELRIEAMQTFRLKQLAILESSQVQSIGTAHAGVQASVGQTPPRGGSGPGIRPEPLRWRNPVGIRKLCRTQSADTHIRLIPIFG